MMMRMEAPVNVSATFFDAGAAPTVRHLGHRTRALRAIVCSCLLYVGAARADDGAVVFRGPRPDCPDSAYVNDRVASLVGANVREHGAATIDVARTENAYQVRVSVQTRDG